MFTYKLAHKPRKGIMDSEFLLTRTKYYSSHFNTAIFSDPLRIYFNNAIESQALEIYYRLGEKDLGTKTESLFILLYESDSVYAKKFQDPEGTVTVVKEDEGYIVGVILRDETENICEGIAKELSQLL